MEESIYSEGSRALSEEATEEETNGEVSREEYESMVFGKYKRFYAEDTQKMINKRFKKYKELEEYTKKLEQERSEFEARLKEETERSAQKAKEELISEIRARRMRPEENGILISYPQTKKDISSYSRTERAQIAKRASMGEKVII